ncbi:MAG TPA: FHA domain-containing protein [Kofleriaceae bacterium]|jgi:pSer/pThr/pTyr-binding forkhead associated (FHA) protein
MGRPLRRSDRNAALVEMDGGRMHRLSDLCTIGRHPTSLVVLPDPAVSRHHAEVIRTPHGRYLLRDLCTRGGTFVGGDRVIERFLVDGDEIRVGQARLRFEERSVRPLVVRRRSIDSSSAPPV